MLMPCFALPDIRTRSSRELVKDVVVSVPHSRRPTTRVAADTRAAGVDRVWRVLERLRMRAPNGCDSYEYLPRLSIYPIMILRGGRREGERVGEELSSCYLLDDEVFRAQLLFYCRRFTGRVRQLWSGISLTASRAKPNSIPTLPAAEVPELNCHPPGLAREVQHARIRQPGLEPSLACLHTMILSAGTDMGAGTWDNAQRSALLVALSRVLDRLVSLSDGRWASRS